MLQQMRCSKREVVVWEVPKGQVACINLHESAKWEKLKTRVANTRQRKEECDKGSSSLFILIKKDSADIAGDFQPTQRNGDDNPSIAM